MKILILISLILMSGCTLIGSVTSGSGVVVDSETDNYINNANIELYCTRNTGFHSTEHLRTIDKTSNNNGNFSFSSSDVTMCDTVYIHASKEGYIETSSLHVGYGGSCCDSIPKKMYLTKNSDANIVSIRSLCSTNLRSYPMSEINKPIRSEEMRVFYNEYRVQYSDFIEAIKFAKTSREIDYVKECHCDSLKFRFDNITEEGFKILASSKINAQTHNKVINYCDSGT